MTEKDLERIKKKFGIIDSKLYWGDDFDVRFYLISRFSKIKNKTILDVGGGLGVICSEFDKSNFCVNLDFSQKDLVNCRKSFNNLVNELNCSMTDIALKDNSVDYVICAHVLEVAKLIDIENEKIIQNKIKKFPTVDKVMREIHRVLKHDGILLLTTPNNAYYRSTKLTYDELKFHTSQYFKNFSLYFYNTFPRLNSKNRKLNMANVVPKIMAKIIGREKIIQSLIHKDNGIGQYSVSFFIEAKKFT
jgi:ubiquinone/menaquinone biosynthesis C-methylase UbiE